MLGEQWQTEGLASPALEALRQWTRIESVESIESIESMRPKGP